ncbi:hypothetical protein RDWZM_006464 [Blomia tropicalis]|uniref:Uncharacterized protein n=1 Tax=Blomia tropicalis TaxID=40697 RepID=A0A9Q0MAJ6_BLOTA|nr:hypothetical protein RDWZM_006464 [Blomia tropicalis]
MQPTSQQSQLPKKHLVKGSVAAASASAQLASERNRERERDYWMERSTTGSYPNGTSATNSAIGIGNYNADTNRMDSKKLMQHAQLTTFGAFVPQDSQFNPIIPVLPRWT